LKPRHTHSGFDNFVGPDAGSADFHALHAAVNHSTHALEIGAEGTFDVFDDVHTDTALFLGQTTSRDTSTKGLSLATNITNFAHFTPQSLGRTILWLDASKTYGKNKSTRVGHGLTI
jgi:hypothetical protein